jgi:hypothetical protein
MADEQRAPMVLEGRSGIGPFKGEAVTVLPCRVFGASPAECVDRVNELLDALEETVARFEWAGVVKNPRDGMEACEFAAAMYAQAVRLEAAEAARNQ